MLQRAVEGILAGVAFVALFATVGRAQAAVPRGISLTGAEVQLIDRGQQVLSQEKIATSAWPRVSVYQFIHAKPEEAAAVFVDYERHASFIPGLDKSVISKRVSPSVAEVDYVLAVPLYADEDYTVRDSLSADSTRTRFRIDWTMVRARSTKQIVGSATFEPHRNARTGEDGTLVSYVNLVSPGQFLAGPFRGRALGQVRETVTALARQVETQRSSDRVLLASQVAALREALSGRSAPAAPPPSQVRGVRGGARRAGSLGALR